MYRPLLDALERELSLESLKQHSLALYTHERGFCYREFLKSAEHCRKALKEAGASRVRMSDHQADGETTFMDHTIPQAWEVDEASLEIIEPNGARRVLADRRLDPMCVANRCPATPRGGIEAEVVTEEAAEQLDDLRGKLVFSRRTSPSALRRRFLPKRPVGLVYSHSVATHEAPDGTFWINGWGFPGWYHTKEDERILCFSLTPRNGLYLEDLLRREPVTVRVEVRSKTYDGTVQTIAGVLPGEEKDEIVLLAHIYEPFIPDDAVGAAALFEIARGLTLLRRRGLLPPLKKTIRFLISQEQYGFAAYFAKRQNRERVVCAINLDGICYDTARTGEPLELRLSPRSVPFFGDLLLKHMATWRLAKTPWFVKEGNLSDDTFLSDLTIGIPTNWLSTHPGKYHHNSADSFDRLVSWDMAATVIPLIGAYAGFLATAGRREIAWIRDQAGRQARGELLGEANRLAERVEAKDLGVGEAARRLRFFCEWQEGRLASLKRLGAKVRLREAQAEMRNLCESELERLDSESEGDQPARCLGRRGALAENLIVERKTLGPPFSLARIPPSERMAHPNAIGNVLNWADGKRTLLEALDRAAAETGIRWQEKQIAEVLRYLELLERYGYVALRHRVTRTRASLRKDLRKLGLRKGDRVIVHSSLSSLGHVEGGAETVCRAIMDVVTEAGVVMMPSFNHYGAARAEGPGYYDPTETPTSNGAVPEAFWRLAGVSRSLDPSHPVAVWGKDARSYVENHHRVPTFGPGNPLHLLEGQGGKVILIDCPTANTFHHVVEMTNSVPCLGARTEEYPVKLPSGRMVRCRTWGWRNGTCPINERAHYLPEMEKRGLLRKGKIGHAEALTFSMPDCRAVIEEFLAGKIAGYTGCAQCTIRPRVAVATVESDWDAEAGKLMPGTTAYVGEFQ